MKRVGILRGGVSPEYEISLKTGANVQRALIDAGFEAIDMLLDKEGVLHIKGIPSDLGKAQANIDVVFNALHGSFGEDGKASQLLDQYGIPYTGSGTVASAIAFNKSVAKEKAQQIGLKTPQSMLVVPEGTESVSEVAQRIYRTMAPPWVVKPLSGGGSVRTFFAFTPLELVPIVEESISHSEPFLVEQYIAGREAAVGVIDRFRNTDNYVLPVVEVASGSREVLRHDIRRKNEAVYAQAHGSFSADEREQLSVAAKKLHQTFGAADYSQSEFIIDRFGKIWFIELDTHPHLTDNAPFLVALDAVGAKLQEFVQSVVDQK